MWITFYRLRTTSKDYPEQTAEPHHNARCFCWALGRWKHTRGWNKETSSQKRPEGTQHLGRADQLPVIFTVHRTVRILFHPSQGVNVTICNCVSSDAPVTLHSVAYRPKGDNSPFFGTAPVKDSAWGQPWVGVAHNTSSSGMMNKTTGRDGVAYRFLVAPRVSER